MLNDKSEQKSKSSAYKVGYGFAMPTQLDWGGQIWLGMFGFGLVGYSLVGVVEFGLLWLSTIWLG